MRRLYFGVAVTAAVCLQPYTSSAQTKTCRADNGVMYDARQIFDEGYIPCYPTHQGECPPQGSVCANHALVKLANYSSSSGQDLIYSPHRGLWGQTYGSRDEQFTSPPGQNTNQAFQLITSFAVRHNTNAQGRPYGNFLRGQIVELDMVTNGNDVQAKPGVVVDHYVTTDNAVQGTLNEYVTSISDIALTTRHDNLQKRDFSASPMRLSDTPVSLVTKSSVLRPDRPGFGLIAFHDIKARRGDIQCQVFKLQPNTPDYEKYRCKYNEELTSKEEELRAEVLSVRAMSAAGGGSNVVMKTTASYDEMVAAFAKYGNETVDEAKREIRRYQWQPHPKGTKGNPDETIGSWVNYIHGWLVNVPRSVEAWETNIYYRTDLTNQRFCVTSYDPNAKPYGRISVKLVSSGSDGCAYGPYVNILDYIRQNTGNPNYFGFTEDQKKQGLISGNRANLWLLDTSAPAGTSDREYRWQMLGSDPKYNMSDIVRSLSYPYLAYQIITADRLDVVYEAINKGLYPKSPLVEGDRRSRAAPESAVTIADVKAHEEAEARAAEEQ